MVDDFKSLKENFFKVLSNLSISTDEAEDTGLSEDGAFEALAQANGRSGRDGKDRVLDARSTRALLGAIFAKAGKSKDEVVQIVAREIGMAVAAMLKEPMAQLAKHQKLQITFEFVPKEGKNPKSGKKIAEDDHEAPSDRVDSGPTRERTKASRSSKASSKRYSSSEKHAKTTRRAR